MVYNGNYGKWNGSNYALSEDEIDDNARYIQKFVNARLNYTNFDSLCAVLGNMRRESFVNPNCWQSGDVGNTSLGYGLSQWTPANKLKNNANTLGLSINLTSPTADDMDNELEIWAVEMEQSNSKVSQWTNSVSTDNYNLSGKEFLQNKNNHSLEVLVAIYCRHYEKAGVEALSERIEYANYFKKLLNGGSISFSPRLNDNGIRGNKWYYELNPFYNSGYGLPNCTCYAWGRRGEITNKAPNLSLGNADEWYGYNRSNGIYPFGNTPKLGAIICFEYTGDKKDEGGHVGVVEEINGDTITTSNSAYGGAFFYTQKLNKNDNYKWADYVNFLGFIYLENDITPPTPVIGDFKRRKKFTFLYTKKRKKIFKN